MPELRVILPRPARAAKQGRCGEAPSVKTMLCANPREAWRVEGIAEDAWLVWRFGIVGVFVARILQAFIETDPVTGVVGKRYFIFGGSEVYECINKGCEWVENACGANNFGLKFVD